MDTKISQFYVWRRYTLIGRLVHTIIIPPFGTKQSKVPRQYKVQKFHLFNLQ